MTKINPTASNQKTAASNKKSKGVTEKAKPSYPPYTAVSFTLDRETQEALAEVEARTGERRWDIVPRLIRLERARLRKEEARKKEAKDS